MLGKLDMHKCRCVLLTILLRINKQIIKNTVFMSLCFNFAYNGDSRQWVGYADTEKEQFSKSKQDAMYVCMQGTKCVLLSLCITEVSISLKKKHAILCSTKKFALAQCSVQLISSYTTMSVVT